MELSLQNKYRQALLDMCNTIEATGGLCGTGLLADADWTDLANAYTHACSVLGLKPKIAGGEDDHTIIGITHPITSQSISTFLYFVIMEDDVRKWTRLIREDMSDFAEVRINECIILQFRPDCIGEDVLTGCRKAVLNHIEGLV